MTGDADEVIWYTKRDLDHTRPAILTFNLSLQMCQCEHIYTYAHGVSTEKNKGHRIPE